MTIEFSTYNVSLSNSDTHERSAVSYNSALNYALAAAETVDSTLYVEVTSNDDGSVVKRIRGRQE